jgi:hypothetical protein
MTALYVIHAGRRYEVLGETTIDGEAAFNLAPTTKHGARIVARMCECREERRRVRIKGYKTHRLSRPVVLDLRMEKGEIHVELRLLGMRKGFSTTLEGMYDMAARQAATNEARDRAWQREQRRFGRAA